MPADRHEEIHEEKEALPEGLIVRTILVSVILAIAGSIVTYLMYLQRQESLRPTRAFPERDVRLSRERANASEDLFHLPQPKPDPKAAQAQALQRYAWYDRERGLVSIPIDRALDLVAREAAEQRSPSEEGAAPAESPAPPPPAAGAPP